MLNSKDNEIHSLNVELARVNDECTSVKNNGKVEHAKEVAKLNKQLEDLQKSIKNEKSTTTKLRTELSKARKSPSVPQNSASSSNNDLAVLDARLKTVEEITKNLTNDVKKLSTSSTKWEQSSKDVSNLTKTINTHHKSIHSIYEKEREKHVIVTGVTDGNELDDTNSIQEILHAIDCGNINPVKVSRLGQNLRADNRPRPILVVVHDIVERQCTLDRVKSL